MGVWLGGNSAEHVRTQLASLDLSFGGFHNSHNPSCRNDLPLGDGLRADPDGSGESNRAAS